MKITVVHDFRCFKEGDVFELDLKPKQITFLIGPNGCGKSTLMFALRARLDSLRELNQKNSDGMRDFSLQAQTVNITPNIEMEGFDLTKACFRDTNIDNPNSFINAATATGLLLGGGFSTQHKSTGQGVVGLQIKYISEVISTIGPKSDERILIGFDEMDDSLDLKTQMRQAYILAGLFFNRYPNASIIFITHSLFTALGGEHVTGVDFTTACYDVSRRKYTTPEQYFADETGFEITVKPIPKNKENH